MRSIADVIVSQLADAYGELKEESRELQDEMDAIKDKIIQLGGNVCGEVYNVSITRADTTSHYGMLNWLRRYHPLIVERFETRRPYWRTVATKLKPVE